MNIYLTGHHYSNLSHLFFCPQFIFSVYSLYLVSLSALPLFCFFVLENLVSTSACPGSLISFPYFLVTKSSWPSPAPMYIQSFSVAWSFHHFLNFFFLLHSLLVSAKIVSCSPLFHLCSFDLGCFH